MDHIDIYITNSFYNSSKHFLVPLIHEGCFDITTVLALFLGGGGLCSLLLSRIILFNFEYEI